MNFNTSNLYLVTSETHSGGRNTLEVATEAIEGGVDILQMREKDKSPEELDLLGKELAKLCRENSVTFIVNDDPYMAVGVGADGVHLGQEDIKKHALGKVREVVGPKRVIGISTHSLEQFKDANQKNVDYIAFGPIFETRTKDYFIGPYDVEEVLSIAKKPVIFIGGINLDNIDILIDKGARNIAVIRAITQAEDIVSRAKEFKEKLTGVENVSL